MTPVTPSSVCEMQGERTAAINEEMAAYRSVEGDYMDGSTVKYRLEALWDRAARAALAERTQQEALTDAQAHTALGARGYREAYDAGYRAATSAANSTAPMQPSEQSTDIKKYVALAERCGAEVGRHGGEMVWMKFHRPSSVEAFVTGIVMLAALKPRTAAPTQAPMQPSDLDDRLQRSFVELGLLRPIHGSSDPTNISKTLSRARGAIYAAQQALAAPTQAAGGEAKSNAREYVAFLEREFGPSKGQNLPHFTIGNVSRAFGAGWIAAAPAAAVEPTPCERHGGWRYCAQCEIERRAAAAPEGLTASNWLWRHKKSGGLYKLIGSAKLQSDTDLRDMEEVEVYQGQDGNLWARRSTEFTHRFERDRPIPATPDAKTAEERKAMTVDDVRAAGGIVHSDGNIFFTNIDKLNAAVGIGDQP